MNTRRHFVKLAGTGIIAAGAGSVYGFPVDQKQKQAVAKKKEDLFGIGIAGFTFMQVPVDRAIEIMKKVGVKNLSLKDFYMPMNSTQEQITAVMTKFKDAGINVYTLGVIYMKSQQSVDQAFEYARMAGVKMIIGAPNYEFLPYAEEKIKKYDIRMAIHNHGPDNPLYPNATDIWNHIKDMDPRVGICIDIGHTTRDGQDPSVDITRYAKRIFDIHIKDVDSATKAGKTVEMGRGIIDIPKVVTTLRKIKYNGMCSLEFEKDMRDPLAGIAESIGYFRGVMAAEC
jgi:sugar phosphate isomerase/epimerase